MFQNFHSENQKTYDNAIFFVGRSIWWATFGLFEVVPHCVWFRLQMQKGEKVGSKNDNFNISAAVSSRC